MLHRLAAFCAAIGALLVIESAGATPQPAAGIAGHYRIGHGGMVIAVVDCGDGRLCGRIAALGRLAATDAHNPQPADQSRPLCGLLVMSVQAGQNISRAGDWQGTFYDPQLGSDYTIGLTPEARGGLRVHAYSGPLLLRRTYTRDEVWERVAPPVAACGAPTPTS
jgi:uncharacterized protein (DUF2147 family)